MQRDHMESRPADIKIRKATKIKRTASYKNVTKIQRHNLAVNTEINRIIWEKSHVGWGIIRTEYESRGNGRKWGNYGNKIKKFGCNHVESWEKGRVSQVLTWKVLTSPREIF